MRKSLNGEPFRLLSGIFMIPPLGELTSAAPPARAPTAWKSCTTIRATTAAGRLVAVSSAVSATVMLAPWARSALKD